MSNVQNILKAAKKQKTTQPKAARAEQPVTEQRVVSNNLAELESLYSAPSTDRIQGLDYTLYPNGEERKVYDASEEMREIKEGVRYGNVQSKMPNAILQSVLSNPLDIPVPSDIDEKLMNEELQNRTTDIIGKLDARDRQGKVQVSRPQYIAEDVSYDNNSGNGGLADEIGRIIDQKFARLEKRLASGKLGGNAMKLMYLGEGSKFMFMDEANNVYECQLVYKGKGKVKR